jgi:hypothetical protein
MTNTENLLANDLQVDTEVQQHLSDTAKWAKFLAIVGFIFCGILVLATLMNLSNSNSRSESYYYRRTETMSPTLTLFVMVVFAAVWFIASLYTYRFAVKMRTALTGVDQISFNDSLANLSRNYKFLGIVTIVYIGLIILLLVVGILSAASR